LSTPALTVATVVVVAGAAVVVVAGAAVVVGASRRLARHGRHLRLEVVDAVVVTVVVGATVVAVVLVAAVVVVVARKDATRPPWRHPLAPATPAASNPVTPTPTSTGNSASAEANAERRRRPCAVVANRVVRPPVRDL
jgi:hypothetical protein